VEEALARFGQNVRAARKARGWTQEELAERSGLAPVQISRIERGKREIRLSSLLRLMGALEANADALLAGVAAPRRTGR
jgi:transcriptional regulator with XRE-family HTH domain